jgi:hypothetical protein
MKTNAWATVLISKQSSSIDFKTIIPQPLPTWSTGNFWGDSPRVESHVQDAQLMLTTMMS